MTFASPADIFEAAPDPILVATLAGEIISINLQAEKSFAFRRVELIGRPLSLVLPELDVRWHSSSSAHKSATKIPEASQSLVWPPAVDAPSRWETRCRRKDGGEFEAEVSFCQAAIGNEAFVIGVIRDTTIRKRREREREQKLGEVTLERQRAQDQAREAERVNTTLRTTIDTIPAGVVLSDQNGHIVLTNPQADAIFGDSVNGDARGLSGGYTLLRANGAPFPPRDLPLPRAIERGESTPNVPIRVRKSDETERVILAAARPERDNDGRITGAVAVFQDVTDPTHVADALRRSEESLATAQTLAHVGSFDWDIVNDRAVWSAEMYRITGMPREEVEPNYAAIQKLFHPDDLEPVTRAIADALAGKTHYNHTHRIVRRDGEVRIVQANGDVTFDKHGTPVRMVGALQDITEQKRAEEEREHLLAQIDAERARLQTILESAANAIVYFDASEDLVMANPAAARLFGHAIVLKGGRAQYVDQVHLPNGRPMRSDELLGSRVLAGQKPRNEEVMIERPDGSWVQAIESAAPVYAAGGSITGVVTVFQDISALKELERLREEWTSLVAHDLRQPITIITGFAELLERRAEKNGGDLLIPAKHIVASAHQLNRLIADLLDASRIESRRLTLERTEVDVTSLLNNLVDRYAQTLSGHPVRVEMRGALPSIYADPSRLEQILANLLTNAAKYSYAGTEIHVGLENRGRDVLLCITNQGEGIRTDEIPHLFDRFYRAAEARKRGIAGVGLGLYITRGLVEAHGGRVWATSIPGKETTFSFTLPVGERISAS